MERRSVFCGPDWGLKDLERKEVKNYYLLAFIIHKSKRSLNEINH